MQFPPATQGVAYNSCQIAIAGPDEAHAAEPLRLINALQQLGCQHVVQRYWGNSGAAAKSGAPRKLARVLLDLHSHIVP